MLYLPDHNLAFIHIPKNAGKSVDHALREGGQLSFDDFAKDCGLETAEAEAVMRGDVENFLGLGPVKPIHLPLAFIESHLPACWARLRAARSFVFVRPPRERFFSALLQRLGEYGDLKSLRADDPLVAQEGLRVCEWLDHKGPFCDRDFIHFARQTDYVDLQRKRIVSAIFPLNRTDLAAHWALEQCDLRLEIAHEHARREPKPWAKGLQPAARLLGRKLLPPALKRAIYPLWRSSGVFANAAGRYAGIDLGRDVETFIGTYYAGDAVLYDEACATADRADRHYAAA